MKVGELHALLTLDDRQFNSGLDNAQRRFGGFTSTVGSAIKGLSGTLLAAGTATTALGISAAKVGLDYNRLQQSSRAALTTLLGSAEAANAQMDKLDDFAKNSPFAKDVFIRAQQQLLGFGREAGQVIPILDAVQQAVAATGGSSEQVGELVEIIAKIGATGKVTAEDLNQLGERGVDAATIIGSQMGKTGAQIREDITDGALGAEDAIAALTAGMQERFGGATANIKAQFDGAADRVKAAFRDIGASVAAPFIDPNGGGYAVTWANDIADTMRAAQAQIVPLVALLTDRFRPALKGISPTIQGVKATIDGLDFSGVNDQLDELAEYAPLIGGVGAAFGVLGAQALPIIGPLASGLNPVLAGVLGLIAASPELRASFGDALATLEPFIPQAQTLGLALADLAMYAIDRLGPGLGDLATTAAEAGLAVGGPILTGVTSLATAGAPLVDVLAEIVGWLADLPQPVIIAGAAFAALQSPLGQAATAIGGVIKEQGQLLAERAAVQSALGGVGTAAGTMGAAMVGAQGMIRGVGTALKTAFLSNPVGIAIAALSAAIGAYATQAAEARARTDEYRQTLDELGNVTDRTADAVNAAITRTQNADWIEGIFGTGESIADRAREIGVAIEDVQGYIEGQADATDRLTAATDAYIDAATDDDDLESRRAGVERLTRQLDEQRDALGNAASEARAKADADRASATAADDAASQTEGYTDALRRNIDAQREASGDVLDLREAQRRMSEAVLDAQAALERNGATLDTNTAAGIENQRTLDGIATSAWELMASMEGAEATQEDMQAAMAASREQFVAAAESMGMTSEQAQALADRMGLIPTEVTTLFTGDSQPLDETLAAALNAVSNSEGTVKINGNDYPVEQVLADILAQVAGSEESVTIDGNDHKASAALEQVLGAIKGGYEYVTIDGETYKVTDAVESILGWASGQNANVTIGANTAGAYTAFNDLKNTIQGQSLRVPVVIERYGQAGVAYGGWVTPGLDAGGWVPGTYPGEGIDNVAWPLNAGGRTLTQPLAGGEFVVKATQAARHAATLEAINSGTYLPGRASGGSVLARPRASVSIAAEYGVAFDDILAAYNAVIDKNRELAESTADATESTEDSWEDYYDGVSVKTADLIAMFQGQIRAHQAWERNITTLSGRVSAAFIDTLGEMGAEGEALAARLATSTAAEVATLDRYVRDLAAIREEADRRERVDEFISDLQRTVGAEDLFEEATRRISGRVSGDFIDALRDMGDEGIQLAEDLSRATGEQLAYIDSLYREQAAQEAAAKAREEAARSLEVQANAMAGWYDMVRGSAAGFMDFGGAYQQAAQAKADSINANREGRERIARQTAERVAEAIGYGTWEDYYRAPRQVSAADVAVEMSDVLDILRDQRSLLGDWREDVLSLAGKVSDGVLDQLLRMGEQGAPLVASLTEATAAELTEFEELFSETGTAAGEAFAGQLGAAAPALWQVGADLGDMAVTGIAERLRAGELAVQEVLDRWALTVAVDVVGAGTRGSAPAGGMAASSVVDPDVIGRAVERAITGRPIEFVGFADGAGDRIIGRVMDEAGVR